MQRQGFAAALIVIVSKHTSAYARQRRVATDEIMRKNIDKIDQPNKRILVNMHGNVRRIYGDAVFAEISVRRKLPKPVLSAQLDIHGAKRTFASAEKTFVFAAYRTLRITARGRVSARRLFRIAEFGFGFVYGNDKPVRIEARIRIQLRLFHVIAFDRIVVKPSRGFFASVLFCDFGKPIVDFGRQKHKRAHDGVVVFFRFVRAEQSRAHA